MTSTGFLKSANDTNFSKMSGVMGMALLGMCFARRSSPLKSIVNSKLLNKEMS